MTFGHPGPKIEDKTKKKVIIETKPFFATINGRVIKYTVEKLPRKEFAKSWDGKPEFYWKFDLPCDFYFSFDDYMELDQLDHAQTPTAIPAPMKKVLESFKCDQIKKS